MAADKLAPTSDWSFLIGQTLLPGINALLLGSLFYQSRLVPRVIPLLGLIGGPLLISSAMGQVIGINEQYSAWSAIAVLPIFLWELLLGLWLVFKGFRKEAPLMVEDADAGFCEVAEAAVLAAPGEFRLRPMRRRPPRAPTR